MLKPFLLILCLCSVAYGQPSPSAALDTLIAYKPATKQIPDAAVISAAAVLSEALKNPAKVDAPLKTRIDALVAERGAALYPTKAHPLTESDPLGRALAAYVSKRLATIPVESITPVRAEFPGSEPKSVRFVSKRAEIDCRVPGRHSLGLYAVPGAVVTVKIDGNAIGAGLKVRIGAHSDNISKRPSWPRMPEITRVYPLNKESTAAACAFGGLVYVEVPASCVLIRTEVSVEGAIAAPLFVLGETTEAGWVESRQSPGPWAELQARKVVLTVPSEAIRELEHPRPVLEFWDRVLDAAADLAAIPHERSRPERYVADVEISAGYMHSGYPIMTHLDAAKAMVDVAAMQKGQWGLFHELGHNHQQKDWTFDGTTEVTCNLFSMYIIEEVCGKPKGSGHDALAKARERVAVMMKDGRKPWGFEASPDDKATGAGDPFTRLIMYRELIDAFGWEPFKKVFAEYRALEKEARPKTDEERRDQWMVRMSKMVGRDLGAFFEKWGVPVTEGARGSVKGLSEWMPEGW